MWYIYNKEICKQTNTDFCRCFLFCFLSGGAA
nr:MAG TPA: hypothetical protein [Caudoviricetes sp.]